VAVYTWSCNTNILICEDYIECDYIAKTQEEENLIFTESARRREQDKIPENMFVHFDTPLTLEHEINLMYQTGFEKVELMGCKRENHTLMIVATKKPPNINK
jgi:tRNA (cmo5U34)-methyltransferase